METTNGDLECLDWPKSPESFPIAIEPTQPQGTAQTIDEIPDLNDWLDLHYFQGFDLDQEYGQELCQPPPYVARAETAVTRRGGPDAHAPGIHAHSAMIAILTAQVRDLQALYVLNPSLRHGRADLKRRASVAEKSR